MDIHERICAFVNSRDIREHLKKLRYRFDAQEAGWIVANARQASLEERHAMWEEIIRALPDDPCVYDGNRRLDSMHEVLRRYMDLEDRQLERFLAGGEKAFYQCRVDFGEDSPEVPWGGCYSAYGPCLAALLAAIKADDLAACHRLFVVKTYLDEPRDRALCARLRPDGTVLKCGYLYCYPELEGAEAEDAEFENIFDRMWFGFPTPFQKGDILWDPEKPYGSLEPNPVVFLETAVPHYAGRPRKPDSVWDMYLSGYFQDPDGSLFGEVTFNYMDYETCPPEMLTGRRRILTALSNLLKEEIDPPLFAHAYLEIILEEWNQKSLSWYAQEGLRLAGLKPEMRCREY